MLNNKKLQALVLAGLLSVTSFGLTGINSNATNTLAYKEVEGVQSINIVELARLRGERLMEISHPLYGDGLQINLNGKMVHIYEASPYLFIEGRTIPLKTEPVVDSITGEPFDYPLPQIAQKDGDGFLIPMSVIEAKLDIKGDKEGIVIETAEEETEKPKEEDKTQSSTNSGNTNNGSSNNSGSTNSGNTNNGSSNNSGSTNNGSTNNGSSNNSGSTNNGGSTQKPTPTPTPTPEVKPEPTPTPEVKPEVKPEPTPEPSKPVATGISFNDLAGRLAGMGFDSNGTFSEGGMKSGKVKAKSSYVAFSLERNTPNFSNAVKNIFNLLLPTQGNRLYSIVTNPCSNQVLQMDGRTVTIEVFPQGVTVDITE